MTVTYFRRFRMEMDLSRPLPEPELPTGYRWVAWDDSLIEVHAEVNYQCFHAELDAAVFPCLGDRSGCLRLMREIRRNPGFLPEATWLVAVGDQMCGTIQGVMEPSRVGVIQNLGVVAEHRGRHLGRALLLKALHGFCDHGAVRSRLEVTADNVGAVQLYHHVGFRKAKTLYRAGGS